MATLRQQLNELIDRLSPDMERRFLEVIDTVKSKIVLREVVERLEARDVEGAIRALHIDVEAFYPLKEALREAFNSGGTLTVASLPRLSDPMGGRVIVRWDSSNQRAEANIRELAATMVEKNYEGTIEGIRQTILSGYERGQGPSAIGLDLVGRKSRVTGLREGGAIGANSQQIGYVNEVRAILSDPDRVREYFIKDSKTGEWKLRYSKSDKSFNRTVLKAISEGKAVDAEMIGKITNALTSSYVKLRGNTIGRTETSMAVTAAKHEAYLQALNKAGRDESLVTRRWRAMGDRKTRHSHMILNAQEVTGMDIPFVASNGDMMRYPGDREFGAGPASVVNCRCDVAYTFDFSEAYARSRGR